MTQAVILFGHGSRDPLWRLPMEAVAARLRAMQPKVPVLCAYLELDTPTLPEAATQLVAQGARDVRIVPMFLGTGRHAREDLPRLLSQVQAEHPQVTFSLQKSIGEDARVIDLIARIALE
ncbi:CbiX/SirB N-terminal domain-containing protein [Ramlibacter sp. PS3R-8]|uniref:sirohydrochlorin chelatase n=1 Tax=Ramlibacter sp. PS3R-8 TaxID=3133437 RepID=UPI0030A67E47